MKTRIALFPGSFDPFTKGHEDIVLRAMDLFDEIHIVIGRNVQKKRHFDLEWMKEKLTQLFETYDKVVVDSYDELTADYAKKRGQTISSGG